MAEWNRNLQRNAAIKRLRSQGLSIRKIADTLNCSKSVVSYHCSDTNKLPYRHGGLNGTTKAKENWDNRIRLVCEEACSSWFELSQDPEFMGFLGIYWGEGNKARNRGGTGSVGVTNNDPYIIRVAYNNLYQLTTKRIIATIICYPKHDEKRCMKFWQSLMPEALIKIEQNKDKRSKQKWSDSCEYGRCQLRFSDWELFWKITTWLDCWKKKLKDLNNDQ